MMILLKIFHSFNVSATLKEETFVIGLFENFRGNKLSRMGHFFENFTNSEFAERTFSSKCQNHG